MFSYNLVLIGIATLLLRVDYLLLFNPLVLLFLSASSLLLYSDQCSSLEFIFFRGEDLGLDHRLWRLYLTFYLRVKLKALLVDCALEYTLDYSVLRHVSKSSIDDVIINDAFFFLGVIIGAGTFPTTFDFAFDGFVIRGVVLLFLPPMAHVAIYSNFTATMVI